MLLFLLPLIFNPFSFIVRWLPILYLAAWPIIIQTLGQDALLIHALLLMAFVLACDITRDFMLRLIGFDLISMPVGILVLAALLSNKGSALLSFVVPVFGTMLVVVEPLILIVETFIVMDMLKVFNKWIARMSNIRDEDSSDLSTWDPPLTRGSLMMRFVVILITIASYLGVYMILGEAKQLSTNEDLTVPIHFNHATSLLVTLQLIALTSTIYKEAGILSESAMVALAASVPIFIAAWSYHQMKLSATSSSWTSYFPFSIFASGSGSWDGPLMSASDTASGGIPGDSRERRIVFDDHLDAYQSSSAFGFDSGYSDHHQRLDYGALERTIHLILPTDNILKQALLASLRQLIMLINSILGLSWSRLAKYYFGPDFWYVLGGRLVCLIWFVASASSGQPTDNVAGSRSIDDRLGSGFRRLAAKWRRFNAALPINRMTLVKCLIVLVYAQMLMKETENKVNLADQTSLLLENNPRDHQAAGQQMACCSQSGQADPQDEVASSNLFYSSRSWLQCVWNSARACSGTMEDAASGQFGTMATAGVHASRASRLLDTILALARQCLAASLAVAGYVYNRILTSHLVVYHIYTLWLIRWRSPIIQRLMQSAFIQISYICSLLVSNDDGDGNQDDD